MVHIAELVLGMTCFLFYSMKIFMAIISGVMQVAGTGDQVEDIGDARSAISSLLGIPDSVIVL